MNKKFDLLKSAKYIVLFIFAILAALSLWLMGMVKTNYNISDYLDDSTDTKISLGIMEEEFGLISNVQVMVKDVSVDEAEAIKDRLKTVENVIFVNFNSQSADYYKDNTALFVVLVNGNEYSETAKTALNDIMEIMKEDYPTGVDYGGTVMEKELLREAMQSEIVLILGISLCLVALLMLITAASWIEPLVLLASAGIAVLINMGSNLIFGEISYITKAVASILQLALSMDYSIVLLHSYRAMKEKESDRERAMLLAIKEVTRPVSASALTTIAGLLALLFMSFTIGFDIGIVLMKSIVVSAITALTLLPAMLLLFDRLMQLTPKKPLVIKGRLFTNVSTKVGKIIMPIACALIVAGCILSSYNTYSFVDSCNKNENITESFGDSGTLIVLFEKAEDSEQKEKALIDLLASYKTSDGTPVLKSSVAYSNTVGQIFDVDKASSDLGISRTDAELLFTLYYFTSDSSKVKLNIREFADYALDLIENDKDAEGFVSEGAVKALNTLINLDLLLKESYTADELCLAIEKIEMLEGMTLESSAIKQMYGLYFFDEIEKKSVDFDLMLEFLIGSGMIEEEGLLSDLNRMLTEIRKLTPPNKLLNFEAFKQFVKDNNINLSDSMVSAAWVGVLGVKPGESITYIDLVTKLSEEYPENFSPELIRIINNYEYIYSLSNGIYEYDEFIPTLTTLAYLLTGTSPQVDVTDEATQQLYIMYFIDDGRVPDGRIGCLDFLEYVNRVAKENEVIADRLPEGAIHRLEGLITDAKAMISFLNDPEKYDYKEITSKISLFADSIESMDIDISLSDGAMMGVYVKYAMREGIYELKDISATSLLKFVLEEAETNPLLSGRITDEMRKTIRESEENIISAEKLLVSENYSRILLTVNLPPESEDSSEFVEFLTHNVREIFGEGAYVAGEIATTHDLILAFDDDNKLISSFTAVSIFLIILVIFKSLSLPVILVAAIQGAIWISMSMSLLGEPMFFMSYIMSMCILMGATIDYGILLSTNYVKNRSTMDRREALDAALDTAMPTIFTSGLILMICGFVVGLVATQTSISSVGFLLFRGTMVSVIMITLVLPSLLYFLDKIVLKLTVRRSIREMIASLFSKKS